MQQRLDMVMLPVRDRAHAVRFYEQGLGWTPRNGAQTGHSVKYAASGMLVAMIDRAYLGEECGLPGSTVAASGTTLVTFVDSIEQVDQAAVDVMKAGGSVTSAPRIRDGGLYTFYFTDPDGNPWEVVWSPDAK